MLAADAALTRRIAAEGETVAAFDATFERLISQVRGQCSERAQLMSRVRTWLLQHVWWQESELRAAKQAVVQAAEREEATKDELERLLSKSFGGRRGSHMFGRRGSSDLGGPAPRTSILHGLHSAGSGSAKSPRLSVLGAAAAADNGGAEDVEIDDDMVLSHMDELLEPEAAALIDRMMDKLASNPDSRLLHGVLISSLSQVQIDQLPEALKTTFSAAPTERRTAALAAALNALHAAAPNEALGVLKEHLAGKWSTKHVIALTCAMHRGLDEPGRIALISALEPQLGDEECEFLAAACARERSVAHVTTQTDISGSGWPRVLAEYVELDEGAKLKLLHTLSTQPNGFSDKELLLLAKISQGHAGSRPPSGSVRGSSSPEKEPGGGGGGEADKESGSGLGKKKGNRRGSQSGEVPSAANAALAALKKKRDGGDLLAEAVAAKAGTLHPEEMVLRTIGEIWAKKLVDDHQMDTRAKPRMAMRQFMRDFFLRQYGVRTVALKAIGDFAFSVRHYLNLKGQLERARLENRTRLEQFASMCGLTGDDGGGWKARKVNFFLFFLQSVVGREAAAGKGDAGKAKQTVKTEAQRERLTKKRMLARLSNVTAELARCVPDGPTRATLLERAQASSFDDERGPAARGPVNTMVDLDAFMDVLMTYWEAGEKQVEQRRLAKFDEMVRARVDGGVDEASTADLVISYDEFELIVKDIRKVGGVETHEEHLEMLMDIFDEALQESERLLGEESDVVASAAFATVANRYGLIALLEPSAFVDPLRAVIEEEAQQLADGEGGGGGADDDSSKQPGGGRASSPTPPGGGLRRALGKAKMALGSSIVPLRRPSSGAGQYVFAMVKSTVSNNFLFRHLEDAALLKLVERLREVRCEPGRVVCREGDKGDYFYIVESGVYAVYKRGELVHTYRVVEGQDKPSFGELALMYAKPRAATVRCVEPGTLWALDRSGFREAQKTSSKGIDVPKLLTKVKLLSVLRFDQLQQLRDRMTTQTFKPGQTVIAEGEPGTAFYVVARGSAAVRKLKKLTNSNSGAVEEVAVDVATLTELMPFGEAALINSAPRNASVVALEDGLEVLTLDRSTFESVLGPLQDIIDKSAKARDAAARHVQQQQQQAGLSAADRSSFKLRRRLCVQAGGSVVYLAAHVRRELGPAESASKEYTLRLESIAALAKAGLQEEVIAEVQLLKSLPLLMGHAVASLPPLLATFRDERALYWVFSGRALCNVAQLSKHARFDERGLLFALSCVVCAVEALHEQRVLLRGVAAPLLMVDDAGYVVIVDLRQSRKLEGEDFSYSIAGLPQYLAPEQVRGEGHSFAVDWWSLGVLLYLLATGSLPFDAPSADSEGGGGLDDDEDDVETSNTAGVGSESVVELQVARAILEHTEGALTFKRDSTISELTQDLITALLHPDPNRRMGSSGGAAQLREAPPLLGIDWVKLAEGTARSPLAARAASFLRAGSASSQQSSSGDPPAIAPEAESPDFAPAASAAAQWCAADF